MQYSCNLVPVLRNVLRSSCVRSSEQWSCLVWIMSLYKRGMISNLFLFLSVFHSWTLFCSSASFESWSRNWGVLMLVEMISPSTGIANGCQLIFYSANMASGTMTEPFTCYSGHSWDLPFKFIRSCILAFISEKCFSFLSRSSAIYFALQNVYALKWRWNIYAVICYNLSFCSAESGTFWVWVPCC